MHHEYMYMYVSSCVHTKRNLTGCLSSGSSSTAGYMFCCCFFFLYLFLTIPFGPIVLKLAGPIFAKFSGSVG